MEVGPGGSMLAALGELGAKVDASSEGGICGTCEVHWLEGEPIHRDRGLAPERRRPRPGDKWHLDEMFLRIGAKQHYLWRAVDQHGVVLDILVQSRRNAKAARRFFKKLLKGLQYVPRVIVTDKLRS
jgi:hypothetical protein